MTVFTSHSCGCDSENCSLMKNSLFSLTVPKQQTKQMNMPNKPRTHVFTHKSRTATQTGRQAATRVCGQSNKLSFGPNVDHQFGRIWVLLWTVTCNKLRNYTIWNSRPIIINGQCTAPRSDAKPYDRVITTCARICSDDRELVNSIMHCHQRRALNINRTLSAHPGRGRAAKQ